MAFYLLHRRLRKSKIQYEIKQEGAHMSKRRNACEIFFKSADNFKNIYINILHILCAWDFFKSVNNYIYVCVYSLNLKSKTTEIMLKLLLTHCYLYLKLLTFFSGCLPPNWLRRNHLLIDSTPVSTSDPVNIKDSKEQCISSKHCSFTVLPTIIESFIPIVGGIVQQCFDRAWPIFS